MDMLKKNWTVGMPENDTHVLCHETSLLEAEPANLPILKYIKEIDLLHQNLIKIRIPAKAKASKVPVRCRLVIVSKPEDRKKNLPRNEIPFDTILISRPVTADGDCDPEQPPAVTVGADESQNRDEATATAEPQIEEKKITKHIHPCTCDLTKAQRDRIETHLQSRTEEQSKFLDRIRQIEEQFHQWEAEADEKELRCEIERELMGSQSSCRVPKKKRIFARRLSMVSLGVKQVINWKKPPKIGVKYNRVFELRKNNAKYCKGPLAAIEQRKEIVISEVVDFPATKTSQLRKQYNDKWIEAFNKQEIEGKYPNRPEFVINHSKLWAKD